MAPVKPEKSELSTIFHTCRQCGTCYRKYRKIVLKEDEVTFIEKMGGHVGVDVSMKEIIEKGLEAASREARASGRMFMIQPDDRGCVFLQRINGKHTCKI